MSKLVKLAEEQIIKSVTDAINKNIADGTFIEAGCRKIFLCIFKTDANAVCR